MFCCSQVSRDSRENVVRPVHQAPRELLDSVELPVHRDRRVTVESPDLRVLLVSAEPPVLKVGLSKNEIQYLSQYDQIALQNLTKTGEDSLSYMYIPMVGYHVVAKRFQLWLIPLIDFELPPLIPHAVVAHRKHWRFRIRRSSGTIWTEGTEGRERI